MDLHFMVNGVRILVPSLSVRKFFNFVDICIYYFIFCFSHMFSQEILRFYDIRWAIGIE
jgi:hypothetical protein